MSSEELNELRKQISDELKQRLLSGNFDVTGVFNIGFTDRYDLLISGINISINAYNGSCSNLIDSFLQIYFSTEESQTVYKNIQTGGIRQCLMFKQQQLDTLEKDIQNLKRLIDK